LAETDLVSVYPRDLAFFSISEILAPSSLAFSFEISVV
jgi:hypothetical protein